MNALDISDEQSLTIAEAALAAGISLAALELIVRSEAPWARAWRLRLALRASEAALGFMGRTAERQSIRDEWCLRKPGGELGPAGTMFLAWRGLCERRFPPDEPALRHLVQLMGRSWSESMVGLADELAENIAAGVSVPQILMTTIAMTDARAPGFLPLGLWIADLALAHQMNWPVAMPVLSLRLSSPDFYRPRFRPHDQDPLLRVLRGLRNGANEANRIADDIEARAKVLLAAMPKVRTKGAEKLATLLLNEDAVPGFVGHGNISRFAVRRFMENLSESGGVVELTGRDMFKLYGLSA